MALIPGLHDHGAWQFLMRLPFDKLDKAKKVSPGWKDEIERPLFHQTRRALGLTQPAIVIVQRWTDPTIKPFIPNHYDIDIFRLAFFTKTSGCWWYLPPVPDYPDGMPHHCTVVGVGSELVVLGGSEPTNYENNLDSVFIFSFLSGKWRRGASMPNREQVVNFGCCSDLENKVYVVGGTGDDRKPSKFVMAYDVAKDEWSRLPDMARAREGCQVAFRQGKLHIINEFVRYYEPQGLSWTEIEVLDVEKGCWDSFVSEKGVRNGKYAEGREKGVYKCDGKSRKVYVKKGATWQVLTELPEKIDSVHFSTTWGSKLLVVCSFEYKDDEIECFTVDLKTLAWEKLDSVPDGYTQNITSGCYLEI